MLPNIEHRLFEAKQIETLAIIRLKKDLIRQLTDLNLKEGLFKYLHKVSDEKSIKVVLCVGSPEKIQQAEVIHFLGSLSGTHEGLNKITRIFNAINQLVLLIRSINKFVVHADSGKIFSFFMNIGFACDYRIISNQTVFYYPLLDLGLIPKGGGVYFLSQIVGTNKAMEMLLSGNEIDAKKALGLGLVNKVVSSEMFYDNSIKIAKNIANKPFSLIAGIKKLANLSSGNLAELLDAENRILLESFQSDSFKRRLGTYRG